VVADDGELLNYNDSLLSDDSSDKQRQQVVADCWFQFYNSFQHIRGVVFHIMHYTNLWFTLRYILVDEKSFESLEQFLSEAFFDTTDGP